MSAEIAEAYRLLIADVHELAGRSRRTSEVIARRHGRTAAQGHVLSLLTEGEQTAASLALGSASHRRRCTGWSATSARPDRCGRGTTRPTHARRTVRTVLEAL